MLIRDFKNKHHNTVGWVKEKLGIKEKKTSTGK